jgi:hypothetical protein
VAVAAAAGDDTAMTTRTVKVAITHAADLTDVRLPDTTGGSPSLGSLAVRLSYGRSRSVQRNLSETEVVATRQAHP